MPEKAFSSNNSALKTILNTNVSVISVPNHDSVLCPLVTQNLTSRFNLILIPVINSISGTICTNFQ